MLTGLAWRNLWRQPRRTLLNTLSIGFAAMVMVFLLALQLGTYASVKENVLKAFDGYAQIQPPGYRDDPALHRTIEDPGMVMDAAKRVAGVTDAAPRASSFAIVSRGDASFGAAVTGVDPALEQRVSALHNTIARGRYLEPGDGAAAVIGSALARNLGVDLGGRLTLLGEARDGTVAADVLTVVGVFDTGTRELDRQVVEMPLTRFQDTFAMGKAVNVVVLGGKSLARLTDALPRVRERLPDPDLRVVDWKTLRPGVSQAITLDVSVSMLWYASLLVVVVFIVLNTLLMSVLERTREFGVLLAVGMRASLIGRMVWMELLLLALLGLTAGVLAGTGLALAIGHYGLVLPGAEAVFAQWGVPGRLFPRLDAVSAFAGPLAMLAGILAAGVIPYRRIRQLEPVSAMRAA